MPKNIYFIALCLLCIWGCRESASKAGANKKDSINKVVQDAAHEIAGNFSDQRSLRFSANRLDSFFTRYDSLRTFQKDLTTFYTERNYAFAWYSDSGLTEQASHLYVRLENLPEEGLNLVLPYKHTLDSLINAANTQTLEQKSETELLLTSLYFFFAQRVWAGLEESATQKIDWLMPRKKLSYSALLDSVLKQGNTANVKEPVYRQYNLLKEYLKKYKAIPASSTTISLPGNKPIRPGDTSPEIVKLRKKLFLLGDLTNAGDTSSDTYDSTLLTAVKRFQRRHGLSEDGIAGAGLIRELNIPVPQLIEKIMVNMERNRWLPTDVRGRYLAVNIPEFVLHAYYDDSLLWNMNVVVGKDVNKTVIFAGSISQVVFSPYWNVPASILKKEILPGIQKNPNYLEKNHMEWNGPDVRQKPGPWNSLGQVKFLFPNSHSIYLHDTPSKSLFQESKRAFSHGCIRVANPKFLAQYILRDDAAWTTDRINKAMASGKEQYVAVKDPIPVYITYFTAWVDRQGDLNFREDIYKRDAQLSSLLMKR
ncbi:MULTISPECIES: L,D-transpeptidase family protein [Niastella]|uniref:L,D-transpeptidase family protein n=1 Tax=Niastella soli TaxID=2821487 RepID=A0ABS3YNF2_9BACT|nr:L,D-transpeptidase family protein [Niastella soli]MBO9199348.1 L,D-transpeptidase family protein [Niastella soli]